ncbi:unnamed protein product [Orchesella dallaii]|uniref:Peptidase M14 domain-containing protein n=1 Tax=Orchesella dallaii TaxID=48710 RepID=A0ABP1RXC2_9HEXA
MKFLFLIFLCSLNLCHTEGSGSAVTFPGYKVVRFVPQNQEDVEAAKKMEENPGILVLRQAGSVNQSMDVAIPPHMQTDFMSAARKQMPSSIMTENLESLIDRESMQLAMDESSSSTQTFEAVFTQYMPLEAVNQFIIQLQNLHPDMVNVSTYGKSVEGRELQMVKIEREGGSENKHIMLMDGTTHAREWISTMQTIYFMNELCEQDTPEVNKILDNFVVFVVPVVNPDGVDPNRNFDFGFGGIGSSDDPCSEVYHGPFPLSAPETQALSEVISSLKPMLYLCMHSYSQMMLHSYGCSQPGEINEREAEHVKYFISRSMLPIY